MFLQPHQQQSTLTNIDHLLNNNIISNNNNDLSRNNFNDQSLIYATPPLASPSQNHQFTFNGGSNIINPNNNNTPMIFPHTNVCASCGGIIQDQFYLVAVDKCWHLDCLQCCVCNVKLETEISCFAKDGRIYCKEDYQRHFSKRCARCSRILGAQDFVMKAKDKVFHHACFTCVICDTPLKPGDYFGMSSGSGSIYCRLHYEPLLMQQQHQQHLGARSPRLCSSLGGEALQQQQSSPCFLSPSATVPSATVLGFSPTVCTVPDCKEEMLDEPGAHMTMIPPEGAPRGDRDGERKQTTKGRPRKRNKLFQQANSNSSTPPTTLLPRPTEECMIVQIPEGQSGLTLHQQQQRNKRMRTSFKHHQLRTMKAYFGINHNPDAKDLKQLAQKTGLTKRVLQVWFQNARAKYRRSAQGREDDGSVQPGGKENLTHDDDDAINPGSASGTIRSVSDDGDLSGATIEQQDTLSTTSDFTPTQFDVCYSPQFGCMSDDDSASKALAGYFQHCDTNLL